MRYSFAQDRSSDTLLSPDGKYLLDNIGPLKIRPIDSAEWSILPDTEGARQTQAFWAGDSSAIGFFAENRLKTVPVHGGVVRDLAAAPQSQGGAWRGGVTGGSIVFASNGRLHLVDSSSGAEKELSLRFADGDRASDPTFLPEGDGFGYLLRSRTGIAFYRYFPGSSGPFVTLFGELSSRRYDSALRRTIYVAPILAVPCLRSSRSC